MKIKLAREKRQQKLVQVVNLIKRINQKSSKFTAAVMKL